MSDNSSGKRLLHGLQSIPKISRGDYKLSCTCQTWNEGWNTWWGRHIFRWYWGQGQGVWMHVPIILECLVCYDNSGLSSSFRNAFPLEGVEDALYACHVSVAVDHKMGSTILLGLVFFLRMTCPIWAHTSTAFYMMGQTKVLYLVSFTSLLSHIDFSVGNVLWWQLYWYMGWCEGWRTFRDEW